MTQQHSAPQYLPKRNQNICPHKDPTGIFILAQNWGKISPLTDTWIKQIVAKSPNGILLSRKKG